MYEPNQQDKEGRKKEPGGSLSSRQPAGSAAIGPALWRRTERLVAGLDANIPPCRQLAQPAARVQIRQAPRLLALLLLLWWDDELLQCVIRHRHRHAVHEAVEESSEVCRRLLLPTQPHSQLNPLYIDLVRTDTA